ncbi:MAG: sigma-70 family RNA polymerase sigma factor [Myxococcota bacterium]
MPRPIAESSAFAPSPRPAPEPAARIDGLVRAHAGMVRRALRQLGVAPHCIDDAVQDVFVVLVRRIEDFDPQRSLTNWLWGIAKGVASGYRRSGRRRSRLHSALAQSADAPTVCTRPGEVEARCGGPGRPTWAVPLPADARAIERGVAGDQAADILESFLSSLDEGKCAVFVLSEIEGCTGPEIAERLQLNVNTVYARLRAARRAFDAAVSAHHDRGARPLFAGIVPSLGKPLSLASAAAVATVVALPIPAALLEDVAAPKLAGYHVVPDAAPPVALPPRQPEPASDPAAPAPSFVPRTPAAPVPAAALGDALDFPFEAPPALHTGWPRAGQGTHRSLAAKPRGTGEEPMLTTVAFAALVAAPNPTPIDNDADADAAARVGGDGVTAIYDFFDEEIDGDLLQDDGSVVVQPPKPIYPSLLSIRGHFLPELITLATDV